VSLSIAAQPRVQSTPFALAGSARLNAGIRLQPRSESCIRMNSKRRHTSLSAEELLAQCGLNCGVCWAYVRPRNSCPGCRADDDLKPKTRFRCSIKNCAIGLQNAPHSCIGCAVLPCRALGKLDKRYQSRYSTSPIANLDAMAAKGIPRFLQEETVRWTCPRCGGKLCMHKPECLVCKQPWR
jgi:hypothetical protein